MHHYDLLKKHQCTIRSNINAACVLLCGCESLKLIQKITGVVLVSVFQNCMPTCKNIIKLA